MLYERWLDVSRRFSNDLALADIPSRTRWTFGQLRAAVEKVPVSGARVIFPRGLGPDFLLTTLAGWRYGKIVCPLEPAQPEPGLTRYPGPEIVHLKTTSASTGTARLVAFRDHQLAADATNIVQTMALRPQWPNLGVISLAHSYGFSNLVLPLLLEGIPLVLVGSALPEALRLAGAQFPSVTLAAVPALWRTWQEANAVPTGVRLAISAGAPLPLALEEAVFNGSGVKVHNFYGSSECGGIAYDRSDKPRLDAALAGEPMDNVQLALSKQGCLEVRSRAVAETYWPEPSAALGGGIFRTSDLAELRDGLVFLKGRASDQINVAGRKVSPEAIERVIGSHPGVAECVVFGVTKSGTERGEVIVACVSRRAGAGQEDLKQFAAARLPAWQVPREWWLLESLVSNDRGKLSRAQWKARYLASREGQRAAK